MESISKISSLLETARDLTLEAAQSAGSSRSFGGRAAVRDVPFLQVKKLLDSRHDREISEGLRKVISMMYRSKPCLPYFSSVVKNVASPNIEIKKLVYIYLIHYAESEPDLALLSINTIQKSLTDQNPQVRAMALRVMSGIRVPVISQIVSLAIKRGCGDMSPHVRKAAALAITKCYKLDPNTLPQLLDYLSILLGDKQYYVVGSAVTAFLEICPDRIDLIHKHYRALIRKLVDMDEWGQLALIRLMTVYARKCFPKRFTRLKKDSAKDFYDDDTPEQNTKTPTEEVQVLDPDLVLFLKACKPLLQSRNSAVVVAVVRAFLHLGTPEYLDAAVGPLVALLRSGQDLQQIVLYNIVSVCLVRPVPFVPYTSHFFVRSSDVPEVWQMKIELLTLVFPHSDSQSKGLILSELEHFTKTSQNDLVRESVRAIGRCAQSDSRTSKRCLNLLLRQTSSEDGNLVAEVLTVVRHLIQQDPASHVMTVVRLAKNLDTMTNPEARASIIWLVGEFAGIEGEDNIAPDVLRILAQGFADESEPAKLQIILLAAKVYIHHINRTQRPESAAHVSKVQNGDELDSSNEQNPSTEKEHPIVILWHYILLLARYDTSYDLRDRMRFYKALLSDPTSIQLANLLLLAPKPVPHTPSPSEGRRNWLLGSASLVVGEQAGPNGLSGYEKLPEWVQSGQEPDSKVRDEAPTKPQYGEKREAPAGERLDSALKGKVAEKKLNGVGQVTNQMTLDDWLAEEEGEGSTDSEEDDEDGEEEGEEEEEEEEEDEDDDEEEEDDDDDDDDEESDVEDSDAEKVGLVEKKDKLAQHI
ncbi:AP-3 complex subunit beta [Xylographa opegraphella]|nr:AP-3 complex subunit beta [Xylographa opegraphella]